MTTTMTMSPTADKWSDLFSPRFIIPLGILATGVLMHSMNSLLMSTVMPSAVKDIGGLEYMTWPTTAFLAVSVISASSGSVARALFGARNAYALAALCFGLGSLLAGTAPDIMVMVLGRALQGLGGGLVSALAYVMIRNVFPSTLWPKTFALFSSIWGIAVLIGPLLGGVFANMGYWRGAFLVVTAISIALTLLTMVFLPKDNEKPTLGAFPGFRLSMIGLGIATLSLAAPLTAWQWQAGLILLALILFAATLRVDQASQAPLFPRQAFTSGSTVGLGIWVLFLISAANDPFAIYGPLMLQALRDMDPLNAGYLVAVEALAWTTMAAIVASMSSKTIPRWILIGPALMGIGLVGISVTLASGPMVLLLLSTFAAGAGIGACFSFLSQIVLRDAPDDEGDSAASSIPTVQLVGLGIGAAIAGIIANVTGFSKGLSVDTALSASLWVPGIFAIFNVFATWFAYRLVKNHFRSDKVQG